MMAKRRRQAGGTDRLGVRGVFAYDDVVRGRRMRGKGKTWVMAGGRQARVCAWRVISFRCY